MSLTQLPHLPRGHEPSILISLKMNDLYVHLVSQFLLSDAHPV